LCENIIKTIWGVKDSLKLQLDMLEIKIRPHLHFFPGTNGTILLPAAPYVLSKDEKLIFLGIISDMKTPTNYMGQLAKKVTLHGELKGLKSHDYNVLMQ
jgi:hypothetical protein